MNDATLQEFRRIADAMSAGPKDWQWIGPHMSRERLRCASQKESDPAPVGSVVYLPMGFFPNGAPRPKLKATVTNINGNILTCYAPGRDAFLVPWYGVFLPDDAGALYECEAQ